MPSTASKFTWLSQILYPDGRAFRMPNANDVYLVSEDTGELLLSESDEALIAETGTQGGVLHRLHRALAISLADAYDGLVETLDHIHPDNDRFDINDARDWYRRLGLYDSGSVSLEDMKKAILRKRSFPVVPMNKQHYQFIEDQLQAAGFDVKVYENRFWDGSDWVTKRPEEILGVTHSSAIHSPVVYHGAIRHGQYWGTSWSNKIVNYVEQDKDAGFNVGSNFTGTFYLAGSTISTFADVPEARKTEFRQLVLQLKRAELCAFCFINYT